MAVLLGVQQRVISLECQQCIILFILGIICYQRGRIQMFLCNVLTVPLRDGPCSYGFPRSRRYGKIIYYSTETLIVEV